MSGFFISNNPLSAGLPPMANGLGWETYGDDQYTEGSPLVVAQGGAVILPNNAATIDVSQSPDPENPLYDPVTQRLTPNGAGDVYFMRISFAAFTNNQNGAFNITADISAAGDGSIEIAGYPTRMLRGTGSGNAQVYSTNLLLFTRGTFVANGAALRIESVTGETSLYNVNYFIVKAFEGVTA